MVYDLRHQPSYTIYEKMLYQSEYNTKQHQSLLLSLQENDARPLLLSTPRFRDDTTFEIKLPFSNKVFDDLYASKSHGISEERLRSLFDILCTNRKNDYALFKSFFYQKESVKKYKGLCGDALQVKYFGHACVMIETSNNCILFDPIISYDYDVNDHRLSYSDLPDVIDYVVITHGHQDHLLFEHLIQIRHKVKTVIVPRSNTGLLQDPSLKLMMLDFGFEHVVELDAMETLILKNGQIMAIPFFGEHGDLNIKAKSGYFVEINSKKMLFLADSNNIQPELYENIYKTTGDIDVIFLGMECEGAPLSWVYAPLLLKPLPHKHDKTRRLNGSDSRKALGIVKQFHCSNVYIYAMAMEPWLGYVLALNYSVNHKQIIESDAFLKKCEFLNIKAKRLFMKDIIKVK